jgi:hypothetical protein
MGVIRLYPTAHACSFSNVTGYGTQIGGWTEGVGDCSSYCADLFGALDETTYGFARSATTAGARNNGRFEFGFGDLPQGLTFGTLTVVAWLRTSSGNNTSIDSPCTVRPFVDPATGVRDYTGSDQTITRPGINRVLDPALGSFQEIRQAWGSKPGGGAWTRADLISGSFKAGVETSAVSGYGSGIDITTGGSSASLDIAACYVEIEATPTGLYIEPVRTVLSHQLRLLRRPVRTVSIDVPPHFGDVQPGDTVWAAHELLPWSPGYKSWQQVPLYVVGVTDKLAEPCVKLDCIDLREVYCTYYSPLQVTGVDAQHSGLARLDMGGGWSTTRSTVAFARRPGDGLYQEVAINTPALGRDGLQVSGEDSTQYLLHSTFDAGAGDVFTNWTKTVTGSATVTQDTTDYLVDAPGYQRSALVTTTAAGELAHLQQTLSVGAGFEGYVRIWYRNDTGADAGFVQLYRLVGGVAHYWNDSTEAWQVGAYNIRPTRTTSGIAQWCSKKVPFGGTNCTLTVFVGHLNTLQTTANSMHVFAVEVVNGTLPVWRLRPLAPTTTLWKTYGADVVLLDNSAQHRVWHPERGYARVDAEPYWSHTDLVDGDIKPVLQSQFGGPRAGFNYAPLYYRRINSTSGEWVFGGSMDSIGATLATAGATLPVAGQTYTVACRWTSEDANEYGLGAGYQWCDLWVDGTKGSTFGTSEPVTTEPDAVVQVGGGSHFVDEVGTSYYYWDGYLTNLEIGARCPTDAEMARI